MLLERVSWPETARLHFRRSLATELYPSLLPAKKKMTRRCDGIEKCTLGDRRGLLQSKYCAIGAILLFGLGSLATFIVFWCTDIIHYTIASNLVIREGSLMFERWQRPPVRPAFRVRIFNYTNVENFQSGLDHKLVVREVGPYIYRETLTRVNPIFNEDGTITYQEKRKFHWEGGNADDENVTVPNVPLFAATAFARDMNFVTQVGLTAFLTTMQSKTFTDVGAGGFLWGYDDKIFDMAKSLISWQAAVPLEKFGILAIKRGISPDRITIKSGIDDINEVGAIQTINGEKCLGLWGDERCDRIRGTDGTIFSPGSLRNHNSKLKVYARDMCRSIVLEYRGSGSVRGIPSLTYKAPADCFTSTATKDNCYCALGPDGSTHSPRTCPPAGIFNSSSCNMNMPFLVSNPHFYGGARELLEPFDGLHPRAEDHETVVEIHPRLGVPVGGYSRFQMNVEARKAVGVPFLGRLKDGMILPLLWVEIKIDDVPDFLNNIYYHTYYTVAALEIAFKWISLLGILLSICSAACVLKHRNSHAALRRNVSGQNPLLPIEKRY